MSSGPVAFRVHAGVHGQTPHFGGRLRAQRHKRVSESLTFVATMAAWCLALGGERRERSVMSGCQHGHNDALDSQISECERKHSLLDGLRAPDIRPLACLDSCAQESGRCCSCRCVCLCLFFLRAFEPGLPARLSVRGCQSE